MKKYRKKPVVIEAIRWNGNNTDELLEWAGEYVYRMIAPLSYPRVALAIYTLEGAMTANLGDWIIKGSVGEFYPCKPDIFEMTYEEV